MCIAPAPPPAGAAARTLDPRTNRQSFARSCRSVLSDPSNHPAGRGEGGLATPPRRAAPEGLGEEHAMRTSIALLAALAATAVGVTEASAATPPASLVLV